MTYTGSGVWVADYAQESIHEKASSSQAQRALRSRRKVALGSMVLLSLLGSFVKKENSEYSRRSVWLLFLAKIESKSFPTRRAHLH